jgi:hypothetical protein
MGTWEHIELGELPQHNALGFFCWGRFLKIHTEIKRELFTEHSSFLELLWSYSGHFGWSDGIDTGCELSLCWQGLQSPDIAFRLTHSMTFLTQRYIIPIEHANDSQIVVL